MLVVQAAAAVVGVAAMETAAVAVAVEVAEALGVVLAVGEQVRKEAAFHRCLHLHLHLHSKSLQPTADACYLEFPVLHYGR